MAPRAKSKGRGRNKEEIVSPDLEGVGSTKEPEHAFAMKFSISDWRTLIAQEETELFISGIVEEWTESVLDVWYERYLDRASVPYVWEWYKSNILELVRLDQLAPEPDENPLTDASWASDPEPIATPIDSWAPAAVPFISQAELDRERQESMSVMKSPLQFELGGQLEPLVSDSAVRAQLSSSLSPRPAQRPTKNLETCMDDYSSSDLSVVTATDSCDWWRWAQSRRLDRQQASQDTSSGEEATRRVVAASPETLTGDETQELAYRQYINWVGLVESDEEEVEEEEKTKEASFVYQAGARIDYAGIDMWANDGEKSEPMLVEPVEPPPTPDTVVSECKSCCTGVDGGGGGGGGGEPPRVESVGRATELPAIKQLRALRLSRCSGLLVNSPSASGSRDRLPSLTPQPAEAKPQRRPAAVSRAPDPGHYEQVQVECDVSEPQKRDDKKAPTRPRGANKPPRRRPKPTLASASASASASAPH